MRRGRGGRSWVGEGGVALAVTMTLLLFALLPGNGEAAFYRGGGHRIRVEFRIRHGRVVYGRIATSAFCLSRRGRRHRQRIHAYFGNYVHRAPPADGTETFNWVIQLRPGGRIVERSAGSNTSVSSYEAFSLVARVRPGRMTGGFFQATTGVSSYPSEDDCRTDRFWRAGSHSKRTRPLRFTARRIPGGHPPPGRRRPLTGRSR